MLTLSRKGNPIGLPFVFGGSDFLYPISAMAFDFLFRNTGGFIRMPVWGHIGLDRNLRRIISHPHFLRLKGVRQLSFVETVFAGAMHTRFEHCLGVFHLTKLILQNIVMNPLTPKLSTKKFTIDKDAVRTILASALLHDIGHYPHAHLVEDLQISSSGRVVFDHHQELASRFINENVKGFGSLREILESSWNVDADNVLALVAGDKKIKYAKLISGTLDPDKMDYLIRDAHHCNVPYGNIDIFRLIESFVIDAKHERFAITEKGIAPLESLMFAKYMMMRNVYWQHTVRIFSAMLKRFLQDAVDDGIFTPEQLQEIFYASSDDRLLFELQSALAGQSKSFKSRELLTALMQRTPHKRALTLAFRESGDAVSWGEEDFFVTVSDKPSSMYQKLFELDRNARLRKEKEVAICELLNRKSGLSLAGHEVVIDAPPRKTIFEYKDFNELQVYTKSERDGKMQFRNFNAVGDSQFKSRFILEFEKYTKKFRLAARADVVPHIKKQLKSVMAILAA
jgi:HD superfamily phosphohydrolase